MTRTTIILLLATSFAGCAGPISGVLGSCMTARTASITITRADGTVVADRPAETILFCPPSVTIAASAAK